MFFPLELMAKDHAQELCSRGWLDDFAIHDELALSLFLPFPSDVEHFGFFSAVKQDPVFRVHASIRDVSSD